LIAGSSASNLNPVSASKGVRPLLCLRSRRLSSVIPVIGEAGDARLYVIWDPTRLDRSSTLAPSTEPEIHDVDTNSDLELGLQKSVGLKSLPFTCVAQLSLPSLSVKAVSAVDRAATALFDTASQSLVTVGFSLGGTLVLHVLNATSLLPQMRYRLPVSTSWVVQAPNISDGFVLLVGSEEPSFGTVFGIDLQQKQVYEVRAPSPGHSRPRRQRLPKSLHVERLIAGGAANTFSEALTLPDGPCSITAATASDVTGQDRVADSI